MNVFPLIAVVILFFVVVPPCWPSNLGVVGKTYPIVEKDALVELQERAGRVDWKKQLKKIKPEDYRPDGLLSLPRATRNSVKYVDMSYVLDIDIPDGKGGILYPRGYTFNPLDYVPYRRTLVIINADDRDQVRWFVSSEYAKNIDVTMLISEGSYFDAGKELKRPVFYADRRIIDRFQVDSVPAVIRQSGRVMEVQYVHIQKNHQPVRR